jgi:predicted nucleic acid-binding protein
MTGQFPLEELEQKLYELVVSSGVREGNGLPIAYVLREMLKAGYSDEDFLAAADSLEKKGLLTDDAVIADTFFDVLGAVYPAAGPE